MNRLVYENCSACGQDYECEFVGTETGYYVERPEECPHCDEPTED